MSCKVAIEERLPHIGNEVLRKLVIHEPQGRDAFRGQHAVMNILGRTRRLEMIDLFHLLNSAVTIRVLEIILKGIGVINNRKSVKTDTAFLFKK